VDHQDLGRSTESIWTTTPAFEKKKKKPAAVIKHSPTNKKLMPTKTITEQRLQI
jgi:hypothetical protein